MPGPELALLTSKLIKPDSLRAFLISCTISNCTSKCTSRDAELFAAWQFHCRLLPLHGGCKQPRKDEERVWPGLLDHTSLSGNEGVWLCFLPKPKTSCGL